MIWLDIEGYEYSVLKGVKELTAKPIIVFEINPALVSSTQKSPNLYCNKTVKKSGGCNTKIFVEDFSLVLGISTFGNFCFIDNAYGCFFCKKFRKKGWQNNYSS